MVKRYTKRRKVYRRYRKRVYKAKRRMARKAGDKVYRIRQFPPSNMSTVLKYREVRTAASTAGTYMGLQYGSASIYDPFWDSTGGTVTNQAEVSNGQPGWFDKFKDWYRAYIVDRTDVRIKVVNNAASLLLVQVIAANTITQGAISTSIDWSTLRTPCKQMFLTEQTGSMNSKSVSMRIDNYAACGANAADRRLTQANPIVSAVGSYPTLGPMLQIKAVNATSGVNVNFGYMIEFTYHVRFIDLLHALGADS